MKLYGTIASERAKKGQGGNEHLKIIIRNEAQQCIAYITIKPGGLCHVSILDDIDIKVDKVLWIGTDDDKK